MKRIGSFMAILGIIAVVYSFMDRVPTILSWINNWGEDIAWVIKIGLIIVGGILYFRGNKQEGDSDSHYSE